MDVASYIRVSTERQKEEGSHENQREQLASRYDVPRDVTVCPRPYPVDEYRAAANAATAESDETATISSLLNSEQDRNSGQTCGRRISIDNRDECYA
ncbi:hypothetical protein [Halomarina pelagica]|uniref:hypothetical protein n=1 Tax=Halomarina pelagica TaxID=2961599 RepID=UPI0020C4176C|nr:hypothetical protein [Halomarina sp. BND7]